LILNKFWYYYLVNYLDNEMLINCEIKILILRDNELIYSLAYIIFVNIIVIKETVISMKVFYF
jgi:hypothetical protein